MQLSDWSSAERTATASLPCECTDNGAEVSETDAAVLLELGTSAASFTLENRHLFFSERTQELFELNATAAGLIDRLRKREPLDVFRLELTESFSGQSDEAERLIIDWSEKGIVGASIDWDHPYLRKGPAAHLPLNDISVEIRFGGDSFGRLLATAYGHLCQEGLADYRAAAVPAGNLAVVQVEGRPASIVPRPEAGAELRARLVELVLDCSDTVALHAACLVGRRGAILLTGGPGTGKSTLAATLSGGRLACEGDDIVLLDPVRCAVKGVPLPLTIKEGAWGLIDKDWPEFIDCPAVRRKDQKKVRYLPLQSVSTVEWMPVRAFVDLRREDGARPSIHPLSKIDCLRKLCGEAHVKSGNCTPQILAAMIAMVNRAEALQLRYDEASNAANVLERHLGL